MKRLNEEKEKKKIENQKKKGGKSKEKSLVEDEDIYMYVCPECEEEGEEAVPWVPCDNCTNWLHIYCTEFASIDEEDRHKYTYKCRFC